MFSSFVKRVLLHVVKKKVSQQYYIFLLHFASAMTKVSLTANVIATMMATAPAMIYHHLFYDSYKTIVGDCQNWYKI